MPDMPKGFTFTQDCQMRILVERAECDWVKALELPKGVTKRKAMDWFMLNGYKPDAKSKIGYSKATLRRDGNEE